MMTAEAGAFWILGTDTEIGKTAVAAGLLGALSRRALKRSEDASRAPLYVKPVQTGAAAPGAGDADRAREAGFPAETLFSFAAPLRPHSPRSSKAGGSRLPTCSREFVRASLRPRPLGAFSFSKAQADSSSPSTKGNPCSTSCAKARSRRFSSSGTDWAPSTRRGFPWIACARRACRFSA